MHLTSSTNYTAVLSSWTDLAKQLMKKMTAKGSLSFAVLMVVVVVLQCGMTEGGFTPVKWSPHLSKQCEEQSSPELSAILTTLSEMIVNDKAPTSLPKSCMEIKQNSPVHPSGFYTIRDGNDSGVVVYCNMDDLSSCLALEQTFSGFRKDVDSLELTLSEFKEDVEQSLSEIKEDVNLLSTFIVSPLVSSCLEVMETCPHCKNGIYQIGTHSNNMTFVYCVLENSTYCNVTGPWIKVASWNISEPGSSCPNGLDLFVNGTVSACGIPDGMGHSCQSLPFFSSPVPYSQVCGRMRGYQKGSNDAFFGGGATSIDGVYVDGVSITRGSPRQHIWTFTIGVQENILVNTFFSVMCPCLLNSTVSPPSFVGSDYFCESGCPGYWDGTTFHAADPLWDGEGCGTLEAVCCAAPDLPWFHKIFATPTMDNIEMRVCINEDTSNENVLISSYEIYVL